SGHLRPIFGKAIQLPLRKPFSRSPERPHPPQGCSYARIVLPRGSAQSEDRSRFRRPLHRALLRLWHGGALLREPILRAISGTDSNSRVAGASQGRSIDTVRDLQQSSRFPAKSKSPAIGHRARRAPRFPLVDQAAFLVG